jgi:hypothetical protein
MTRAAIGRRDNFFYLFAALLVLIVVGPVLTVSLGSIGILVAESTLSATLVIALWSLQSSRAAFFFGIALVAINVMGTVGWLVLDSKPAALVSRVSGLVFLFLSISGAVVQVFRQDRVDLNKVVGALCIYLLIGAIFALLFHLLQEFSPGSFAGLEGRDGSALPWRLLYFSFVTLSTLGYGDVLPLTLYAETLVTLEAVLGQFYLAVLVAGLVGAYLSDRESSPGGATVPGEKQR